MSLFEAIAFRGEFDQKKRLYVGAVRKFWYYKTYGGQAIYGPRRGKGFEQRISPSFIAGAGPGVCIWCSSLPWASFTLANRALPRRPRPS